MIFDELLSLEDIKNDLFIKEHILWDIEPRDLMEPRLKITEEGKQKRAAIKGYIFYIDTADTEPILFMMRHTANDYAETVARIDSIPREFLLEAIEENKDKVYFKMYPINQKVEDWLKKELG